MGTVGGSVRPQFARFFLVAAAVPNLHAALSVTLTPSVAQPALVGQIVTWTATASGAGSGPVSYRFRARLQGREFRTVRDYGPVNTLDWTASEREGTYEIEASVRDGQTGDTGVTTAAYAVASRVAGGAPAVNPTANPLVFLYSALCPAGARMRVAIAPGEGASHTPWKECDGALSMNFYLAGFRPNSEYRVRHEISARGQLRSGPELAISTSGIPLKFAGYRVLHQEDAPFADRVLLQSTLFEKTVATDLQGNIIWYYPGDITFLTRPAAGGRFFGIREHPTDGPAQQIVCEFDLAGTTLRETNAARISEQLAAAGKPVINGFHHEARELPDGKLLVLAGREELVASAQGPGQVDVLGDVILVLDQDLQVLWSWDAFDHLDLRRAATLNEICTPTGGGCPPFHKAQQAKDWLHGNSVQLTNDGNLLYSARHQDWLLKIDYRNGEGDGHILWRLGDGGDFTVDSTDPSPWFSHQHDAGFVPGDDTTLLVFDNGNVRQAADANAHSRGQAYHIDEEKRSAKLLLNADLGGFSFALGTAERLPDGNYHFESGWLPDQTSRAIEVDASGNVVYAIEAQTQEYRSFRMKDLYTPPDARERPPQRRFRFEEIVTDRPPLRDGLEAQRNAEKR